MDYRKLFVITRELQKKLMPDDLMQLTFEFVGDLNETVEELSDKHLFYRIEDLISGKTYAHYCSCCDIILCYKTSKGLARHCESNCHKKMKEHLPTQKPKKSQIINEFKWVFQWSVFFRNLKRSQLKVVHIKYKKPV